MASVALTLEVCFLVGQMLTTVSCASAHQDTERGHKTLDRKPVNPVYKYVTFEKV